MKKLLLLASLVYSITVFAKPFKLVLSYPESVLKADGDRSKILQSEVYLQVKSTGEMQTKNGTIATYEIISPKAGSAERRILDNYFEMNDPVRPHRKDVFALAMSMLWQNCNLESSEVVLDMNFDAERAVAGLAERKRKGEPVDDPSLVSFALNGCHAKLEGCAQVQNTFKSAKATDEEKAAAWSKLIDETSDANLRNNCCLNSRMDWMQDEGRWKVSKHGHLDVAAFYDTLKSCDRGLWSINGSLKRSFEKTPSEVPEKHTAQK